MSKRTWRGAAGDGTDREKRRRSPGPRVRAGAPPSFAGAARAAAGSRGRRSATGGTAEGVFGGSVSGRPAAVGAQPSVGGGPAAPGQVDGSAAGQQQDGAAGREE